MVYKKSTSISAKQRRIARAHVVGQSNSQIGAAEYPKASKTSQRQIVYKELKKPTVRRYVEQTKLQALKKYDITWERVMKVIDRGLEAQKNGVHDIPTQMKAAKQVVELIEPVQPPEQTDITQILPELTEDMDEIELIRLLRRKS